ncbi:F-box/LRR-repeat protein 7-like [Galleria mellonella]|uniref:F-box/LRR-repeat protein 7-like n=1 Tax=Galleria mellonella TaxID=7137 RepID=A0A6J3BV60_GALME|nr:F-box/LRR-repeat protein 7-like [Galleria mellonella]XP_026759687.2 F-box/LRR-repeat protein 7-like [Galleria mellonella]XP_031763786.2 F-box/LRR-repeat protein 7-like [Galleria mellonella]XP_031763791.2 F-box/LRR-repeat protein 7-like [Galleria mellonella]XP_052748736.1 F-box/LRR-repeat protein 7-like [Galleria mellonella]
MTTSEKIETLDVINKLPDELLISIFKLLPLESLLHSENVCKRWRKLVQDKTLWKNIVLVYSGKPGQSEDCHRNIEILLSHSELVHCLKLQYVYNYSLSKLIAGYCDNLISLELVMCSINKSFGDDITKWPNLKKLNLKNSVYHNMPVEMEISYNKFKYLEYLALSDFGLSSTNCNDLLQCKYLSHILIEKIKNLNLDFVRELICSKQNILETLHIYGGAAVDDHCLQLLSQCRQLKDLAITRCENLKDEGLVALANLQQIKHLQIWNNKNFTEKNLLRTLSSPNIIKLETLSLSKIENISPVIVDVISEYYKNLKFLAVYQCRNIVNTDYEKQLKSKFRNIDVVLY